MCGVCGDKYLYFPNENYPFVVLFDKCVKYNAELN